MKTAIVSAQNEMCRPNILSRDGLNGLMVIHAFVVERSHGFRRRNCAASCTANCALNSIELNDDSNFPENSLIHLYELIESAINQTVFETPLYSDRLRIFNAFDR